MATNLTLLLASLYLALGCNVAPQKAEARNLVADSTIKSKATESSGSGAKTRALTNDVAAADMSRIQGDAKAPVWVIVMSDFQCPVCKAWHDQVYNAFYKEYVAIGKVRFAYVNFPLKRHQHSFEAAEAAMCSGVQGKFWPMQEQLFATQEKWSEMPSVDSYFTQLAQKSGVDVTRYKSCIQSHTTRDLIQSDYDRGVQAGVDGTPTIFVQNRMIPRIALEDVRVAINDALAAIK